jgi:hypothetical protein
MIFDDMSVHLFGRGVKAESGRYLNGRRQENHPKMCFPGKENKKDEFEKMKINKNLHM